MAWGNFRAPLYEKVFRYALADGENFLVTVQMFQSSFLGRPYFYAPYGPVAADENRAAEYFAEMAEKIRALHPRAIFLRTEPRFAAAWGTASPNVSPHQTLVLDLSKSQDQLLAEMHAKTRYNIHVAEKHGVEVRVEDAASDAACELLAETSRRAGIRGYTPAYYKKIPSAKVYCAYLHGDLLAANIVLRYGDTSVYLFGGSSSKERSAMAPYLAQWRAICDAREAGAKIYDFWGVETDPSHPWAGFSRFKLGFGGEVKTFGGTRDSVFGPAWYNAYRAARRILQLLRTKGSRA